MSSGEILRSQKSIKSRALLSGFLIALLVPVALIGANGAGLIFSRAVSQPTVGFSSPVNLSNDNYQAHYPWVSTSGSNVYVSWTEEAHGIYFRYSSNNGQTWNPPTTQSATRLSQSGGVTSYPVVAVNGSNVYVVWTQSLVSGGSAQVFVASSNNNAQTFSVAELTLSQAGVNSDVPFIAAYGNNVYVIWHEVASNGFQSVWFAGSTNGGATWQFLQQLDIGKTGQATEPQIAAWGNDVYATWDRGGAWLGASTNNGQTWTVKNANAPNTGTVREPWIAASGPNVYVTWNDNSGYGATNGAQYHPYIMVSNNFGASFTTKNKIDLFPNTTSSWEIQDAAVGNTVYVTWRDHTPAYTTNGDVLLMQSNDAGHTWTPALNTAAPIDVSNDNQITGWSNGIRFSGSTVALAYMSDCVTGQQEPSPNSGRETVGCSSGTATMGDNPSTHRQMSATTGPLDQLPTMQLRTLQFRGHMYLSPGRITRHRTSKFTLARPTAQLLNRRY